MRQDAEMRYQTGQQLERQGRLREAQEQYELAARDGHLASIIRLKQRTFAGEETTPPLESRASAASGKKRTGSRAKRFWGGLVLFLLLFHLLADAVGMDRVYSMFADARTKPGDLAKLVVENGYQRYTELYGHDPTGGYGELMRAQPVNVLSELSPDLLTATQCPCGLEDVELELHYYPEANQLALVRGQEILVLYPVASGPPLPFAKSYVSRRVVNPNGGKGPWGTRGMELQDGYAIHGTNQLELIGHSDVTKGCLRMRNVDIETLYPYVSLGTPFFVVPGQPGKPTFPEGLPPLGELLHPEKEETPGVVYQWKN
ncbi:L,D-transpeptidase [Tumebacillus flagellatus]|uniref:L,D-TPase catalytic domain-containing protein n=1 Tax=Tumebacillus flagellatus TaxID=1157490 RepID=A0A074LRD1_9BACL|nr:L,D-transpeptidase [Tumebacillus flagellatus]KEO82398.1 hypothetical protein EL26_15865 [Tumebacillus flagellatus]